MIPNILTLSEVAAGGAASGVRILPGPSVEARQPLPPAPPATAPARTQAPFGAYFGLFRPCDCGHSSAWHSGAFGDAWRAGEQVHGGCEALQETSGTACGCRHFHEAVAR